MKIASRARAYSFIYFFAFLLLSVTSYGQADINSYAATLQQSANDSEKLTAYENVLKACRYSKPDSTILLIKKGIARFSESGFQPGVASLLTWQGIIYSDQNKTDLAQKSVEKSIQVYLALKDYQGMASCQNIIGVILSRAGSFDDASVHLFKSLKIFEAVSDTDGITNTLIKIAENYERSGDLVNALEYYMKGLNIAKDLPENDLVILRSSNIPSVLKDMKDNFISMKKLQKILDVSKNNSYVEVRSLTDAIKDAVYTMDGDTAKTLNYVRYALNLLMKNQSKTLYQGFSLSIKDKAGELDQMHKAEASIDIAPLLNLQNPKQKNILAGAAKLYYNDQNKTGISSISPLQGNEPLYMSEALSYPSSAPYMPIPNSSGYQLSTLTWNTLLNITPEPLIYSNRVPAIQNTPLTIPGYGLAAYLPYETLFPFAYYSYLDGLWPLNFTAWPVINNATQPSVQNPFALLKGAINTGLPGSEPMQNTAINPIGAADEMVVANSSAPVAGYAAGGRTQNQNAALSNASGAGMALPDNNQILLPSAGFNGNIGASILTSLNGKKNVSPGILFENQFYSNGTQPVSAYVNAGASLAATSGLTVNNTLNAALTIANESMVKKNEANRLERLIARCKKNGDYNTAFSLVEQQKIILDSLVYMDSELACTNIESLNNIDVLNSKVNQLAISDKEQKDGKNFTSYLAAVLAIVVIAAGVSLAKTRVANRELSNNEIKLRTANNVKNKLISVIAHDITGSIGFMPLSLGLCRDKSIPEEEKDALLSQLELNAASSFKTLQNMLDWAKAQIQGNILNQQNIGINASLADVLQLIYIAAEHKKITITNNVPQDLTAFADPNHTKFILRNLLSNAVKYSNTNGAIAINAALSEDGAYVVTSVSDQGIGIKPECFSKIFEPSVSGAPCSDHGKGNGIGLSLCKDFVTENGGQIWVESEINEGSTFYFSLKANA